MELGRRLPGRYVRSDRAAERGWPRLDLPNVLWFFGALTASISTLVLIGKIPESQRDVWVLLASLGFLAAYALAAAVLLRGDWWVPGGLMGVVAVSMVPAVGYALTKLVDVYPGDSSFDPFNTFAGGPFAISLATTIAALVAYLLTGFTFQLAVVVTAALFTAQLLTTAWGTSGDDRAITAIVTGAVAVGIGLVLDAGGRRREAFWFHVGGYFAIGSALVYYVVTGLDDGDSKAWVALAVVGALVLLASGPLRRATWATYGALGVYAAITHYLNKDADWISILLLVLSLGIFGLGLVVARRRLTPAAADPAVDRPGPDNP